MNDAELILAQLKAEMAVLKKELDKCLLDFDYENAHFFQKTMHLKGMEITTLQRRVQQNFDDIRFCKSKIRSNQSSQKRWEEELVQNQGKEKIKERILYYLGESKQELNEYLDELIELKRTNTPFQVDSDILIEEVELFLDSENKMFCLEVVDEEIFNYITVEKNESTLVIKYVNGSLRGNRKVNYYFKNALFKLGFEEDKNFVWTLILDKSKVDANKIVILFSTIIFEVIRPRKTAKCNLMV